MYEIRSAGETFRRCDTQFTKKPQLFPDNHFTDEQLETLMDEKQLVVRKVKAPVKEQSDKPTGNSKNKDK